MAEMAKVKQRIGALEAIVTRPQSLRPEVLHTVPPPPEGTAGLEDVQVDEVDEKAALQARAAELGIEVDGRWGIDRLRQEIAR